MKPGKKLRLLLILSAMLILGTASAVQASVLASTSSNYDTLYAPTKTNYVLKQSGNFRVLSEATSNQLWIPFTLSSASAVNANFTLGTLYQMTAGSVYYQIYKLDSAGKITGISYKFTRYGSGSSYSYSCTASGGQLPGYRGYMETHTFKSPILPAGRYNIMVSYSDGWKNNAAVAYQITDNNSGSSMPDKLQMTPGSTRTFSTTSAGGAVGIRSAWSYNTSIVTTSHSGSTLTLYAVNSGTTTVRVVDNYGLIKDITVQVISGSTLKVAMGIPSDTLYVDEQLVNYLTNCSNPSAVTWTSSNKSVATVKKNSSGLAVITAKDRGNCKIYAKYNGTTYTCSIKVVDNSIPDFKANIVSIDSTRRVVKVRIRNLESAEMVFDPRTAVICDRFTDEEEAELVGDKRTVTVGKGKTVTITLRVRDGQDRIPSRVKGRYYVEMCFSYQDMPYVVRIRKNAKASRYAVDTGDYIDDYEWDRTYD